MDKSHHVCLLVDSSQQKLTGKPALECFEALLLGVHLWQVAVRSMSLCTLAWISALLVVSLAQKQFCPGGSLDLNGGTPCNSDAFCARFDSRFRCINGYCCRKTGSCSPNEISIGNTCFPISGPGGPCVHTAQCQTPGTYCQNGICSPDSQYDNPVCSRSDQVVERERGTVKNCMYNPCSVGFGCEYSSAYGQYICCGNYNANNDYTYGKVRMYPGTSMPLQCFKENQCLWVDTPNCVYSYRYRHKVCCSTFNC
ncbi:unnamed protein product [Heligmosomoides polygyrus]|uniref:EB domain-containing protein n=1 Tax=Heligmosomoides polygyrus TaxID=6339 RepID=A0A183FIJ4_HELPZ|nr:unnamed protein product [Heligmosomoides polygyrus]